MRLTHSVDSISVPLANVVDADAVCVGDIIFVGMFLHTVPFVLVHLVYARVNVFSFGTRKSIVLCLVCQKQPKVLRGMIMVFRMTFRMMILEWMCSRTAHALSCFLRLVFFAKSCILSMIHVCGMSMIIKALPTIIDERLTELAYHCKSTPCHEFNGTLYM